MSDTTSKHPEQDEDSQGAVEANAIQDEDDVDLDLDAALFGDDDEENAEPSAEGTAPLTEQDKDASDRQEVEQPTAAEPVEVEDKARQELAERNKVVMDLMTEEQLERYEAFRRSNLSQRNVKRVLQTITGQNISANVLLVMRGMAKVYVGELVEAARLVAHELGDTGPLQPSHYIAAYQQLDQQGKVPRKIPSKKLRL